MSCSALLECWGRSYLCEWNQGSLKRIRNIHNLKCVYVGNKLFIVTTIREAIKQNSWVHVYFIHVCQQLLFLCDKFILIIVGVEEKCEIWCRRIYIYIYIYLNAQCYLFCKLHYCAVNTRIYSCFSISLYVLASIIPLCVSYKWLYTLTGRCMTNWMYYRMSFDFIWWGTPCKQWWNWYYHHNIVFAITQIAISLHFSQ